MMYTPTPAARRPRPPGSVSRPRMVGPKGQKAAEASHSRTPSASASDQGTTLSSNIKRRKDEARGDLSRITASPSEIGDISMALDVAEGDGSGNGKRIEKPSGLSRSRSRPPIGLGLPKSLSLVSIAVADPVEVQPSPPPPYGTELPSALSGQQSEELEQTSTPPCQDSGLPSRRTSTSDDDDENELDLGLDVEQEGSGAGESGNSGVHNARVESSSRERLARLERVEMEERLRVRRATDAAKAIGLEMDFGGVEAEMEESEGEMSEGEMRRRVRELKKSLRQRDEELLMAAQVADQALRNHERVVAVLPSSLKSRIPHLVNLLDSAAHRVRSQSRTPRSISIGRSPHPSHLRRESSVSVVSPITSSGSRSGHFRRPSEAGVVVSPELLYLPESLLRESRDGYYRTHRRKVSRPKLFSHPSGSRQPTTPYRTSPSLLLQQEYDERIAILEQALADAREGEDAQRKLAARTRRDFDKLQRDIASHEQRLAAEATQAVTGLTVGTPRETGSAGWRTDGNGAPRGTHRAQLREPSIHPWRGAKPQVGEEISEGHRRLFKPLHGTTSGESSLPSSMRTSKSPITMSRSLSRTSTLQPTNPGEVLARFASEEEAEESEPQLEQAQTQPQRPRSRSITQRPRVSLVSTRPRKKVSKSSFLSPMSAANGPSPVTPRLKVDSPVEGPDGEVFAASSTGRMSRSKGSPYPQLPPSDQRRSPNPHSPLAASASRPSSTRSLRRPLPGLSPFDAPVDLQCSPAGSLSSVARPSPCRSLSPFASLASRISSMRAFVVNSMQRTLGSELGSDFGDDVAPRADPNRQDTFGPLTSPAESPSPSPAKPPTGTSLWDRRSDDHDEEWVDEISGSDDGGHAHFSSPAPLPAHVSAALSSLAIALGPSSVFGPPRDPIGPALSSRPLTDAGLESKAYELLSETVRRRKIRWADVSPAKLLAKSPRKGAGASVRRNASPAPMVLVSGGSAQSSKGKGRMGGSITRTAGVTLATKVSSFSPPVRWAPGNPMDNDRDPDEVWDEPTGLRPARPQLLRAGSSGSGSDVALAHRRVVSGSAQVTAGQLGGAVSASLRGLALPSWPAGTVQRGSRVLPVLRRGVDGHDWVDGSLKTIPAKVVNDLIVWMIMLLEWVELTAIIVVRVGLETRYKQRTRW